jgi:UrcA family protein
VGSGAAQRRGSINFQSIRMSHETTLQSRFIAASILTAGFLVLSSAAMGDTVQAVGAPQYDRAVVAFGDLNLDSQQGTKALYARLRNGAEDVCSSFEGRDLFFKRLWQTCFDQAVAAAVAQVNRPSLTTLHSRTLKRSN